MAELFRLWGSPELDLFANRANTQLPRCMTDAFSIPWENRFLYAFPPFPLTLRLLQTFEQLRNGRMILIVRLTRRAVWIPLLLDHLVDWPRRLPAWETGLYQGRHTRPLSQCPLAGCLLSSGTLERRDFGRGGSPHCRPEKTII